jgi:serine/threonine-protein kinase
VGCVLYAMLTRAPPFQGENPMSVLYQLVSELIAKDPADRPPTASVVRTRLQTLTNATSVMPAGALHGRAAVAPPTTRSFPAMSPESPVRRRRTRRVGVYAAAAVGAVALLLLVLPLLPDGERTADQREPGTTAASPAVSPSPSPTATDPAGRLAELRALAGEQVAAGEIDAETGQKLDEDLAKIAEDLQKGEPEKAAERVIELRKKLNEQVSEGRVTPAARDKLTTSLQRLAQVLPQRPPGEEGDD